MRKMRQQPTIKDFAELPLIVTVEQMLQFTGGSVAQLYHRVARSRTFPQPVLTHPMRWRRSDLEAWFTAGAGARDKAMRRIS